MYALLDLIWKPTASSTVPSVGKAPAIVRNDPYTHVIRITDGWADLGSESFIAQIRGARLVGADESSDTVIVDFAVSTSQDGTDLLIVIALTAEQTTSMPTAGFWDLQQVDGETLFSGKTKVLDDVTRAS